jgi:hypothetical protein
MIKNFHFEIFLLFTHYEIEQPQTEQPKYARQKSIRRIHELTLSTLNVGDRTVNQQFFF